METGDVSCAIPEDYVEEQLIAGIMIGSFKQYEGLLETLKDINVRDRKQRTLLHLGVSLGKRDWVEGLLAEGADPSLRDGGEVTVADMAEEMRKMYPGDEDRKEILRLVRLVLERDNAQKHRRALHVGKVAEASETGFSHEIADLSAIKESIDSLKSEMYCFGHQIAEEVNKLGQEISDRDIDLSCLETLGVGNVYGSSLSTEGMRRRCVESMMGRTTILEMDEGKVTRVRSMYEELYDMSAITSCVLTFLQTQCRVRVMVDFDANHIGNMKAKVRDHDGAECSGYNWRSFPDFSEMTVYYGGEGDEFCTEEYVQGWFTEALAQMSIHLAFGNGGIPHEQGDLVHERELSSALEAAEGKRKDGVRLNDYIELALNKETRKTKEIYFTSVVPRIIAEHGLAKGMRTLREQVPSLLAFYEYHVMATLFEKARASL